MHPFITYYARLGAIKARINHVIEFLDSHYPSLGCEGQFNNSYDFLKKCLTI